MGMKCLYILLKLLRVGYAIDGSCIGMRVEVDRCFRLFGRAFSKKMIMRTFLSLILSVFPLLAAAFGLGVITVDSPLNAPLKAQIHLISIDPSEVTDIRVRLAPADVFAKAGIARPFYLSKVRFKAAVGADGAPVIQVSSRQNMREPYLNFLLEVDLRGQSMVREYTILLDPPIYTPPKVSGNKRATATSSRTTSAKPKAPKANTKSYGPIKASENLWTIAKKLRPSSSVSIEQMMLALQRRNPQAFRDNNVNRLKQGSVLAIPELDEINTLGVKAARAEFMRQTKVWRERKKSKSSTKSAPVVKPSKIKQEAPRERLEESGKKLGSSREHSLPSDDVPQGGTNAPLTVVETGEEIAANGIEREGYPVAEQDKLKEAIADAEGNLAAVKDINQDIADLKRTLEAKMAALHAALAEKDEAISALKMQLEEVSKADAGDSATTLIQAPAASADSATGQGTIAQPTVQAPVEVAQVEVASIVGQPVDNMLQANPAKGTYPWWKRTEWLVASAIGGLIVILLLVLIFRKKDVHHQEAKSTENPFSYADMDVDPEDQVDTIDEIPYLDELAAEATLDLVDPPSQIIEGNEENGSGVDAASVLTEADIYLAYRRYNQAETLVEKAIEQEPENLALKAKMLEIYAFKRDKSAFASYLDQHGTILSVQSPAHWSRIVDMGQDIVPDHPLFDLNHRLTPSVASQEEAAAEQDGELFEDDDLGEDLDISLDDFVVNHDEIDKDLSTDDSVSPQPAPPAGDTSWDIDLDFDDADFDAPSPKKK